MIFIASLTPDLPAGRYFDATLFEKAAQAYGKESNRFKEIESLYFDENYLGIIERLEGQNPRGEELYFLALAYQNQDRRDPCIAAQEAYLKEDNVNIQKQKEVQAHLQKQKLQQFLEQKNWHDAEKYLSEMPRNAEKLYTRIKILENLNRSESEIKTAKTELLAFSPESKYHAQIAFELYSFQDYLWGRKEALSHLTHFIKAYPKSPYTLLAWYLVGLDRKVERKPDGKRRIHHKNLESAQDAFLEVENLFHEIRETIEPKEREYWANIHEKAILERARTLIEIADNSIGIKQHLYYVYALDSLDQLKLPESQLLSVQVYIKDKDLKSALNLVEKIESEFKKNATTALFAKLLIEKGRILAYQKKYQEAIEILNLQRFEESLFVDESLGAKITKSLCHKELKQYDQAMLVLADVINSEAISSLRIKAMFIRSLIYQDLGKEKLAKRQYDAVMEKGGTWATQEKNRWIKEYNLTLERSDG